MRRAAALSQAGVTGAPAPPPAGRYDRAGDSRIHVTLGGLQQLARAAASVSFLPRQPARSVLQGRHRSRIRGRGLDFEELRDYLPGDDVRAIDWKVTARTGTPHVRVYTEERDRPTLILVDQRMSMFFGTKHNTKSVTAAECAAIAAHRVAAQGDRVGGIIFGDTTMAELRPGRGAPAVTRFLSQLTEANQRLSATAGGGAPLPLNTVLEAAARLATRDHLVILISDFDVADARTETLLGLIARRNDLVLALVSDPSAASLPDAGQLDITDGQLQAQLDLGEATQRRAVQAVTASRLDQVAAWQRRLRLSVLPLDCGRDTLAQVVHLLSGRPV